MVNFIRTGLSAALFCALVFVNGCDSDFLGLFASSDLDERLKARGDFSFIDRYADRAPILGGSYSFMVVADVHIHNGKTWGLDGLIDIIQQEKIKFVVFLGDITETGARREITYAVKEL